MKIVSRRVAAATIAGLATIVLATSCGRAGAPAPPPTPAGASTVVDHARLAGLVPAPAGWIRGEVVHTRVAEPAPRANAETTYTRGDARVDLELIDTAGLPEYIESTAAIAGTDYDRISENGFTRGSRVETFPAVESWNHEDRLGEITVIVAGRFIVHAAGTNVEDLETLRDLLGTLDFAALAALGDQTPAPTS